MMLTTVPVHAAGTVTITNAADGSSSINFTTAQKNVGDTFVVNITLSNGANIATWQLALQWNNSLLHFVSMSLPADNIFFNKGPVVSPPDNSTPGLVVMGAAVSAGQTPFNGSGRIAQLTLKIVAAPKPGHSVETDISFEGLSVDTFFLDPSLTDLTGNYTWTKAQYTYTAPPPPPPPPAILYINPQKVVDPLLNPGMEFNVALSILNGTDVNSWGTSIVYDNSILNATGVVEGDFLKSLNSTIFSFNIQQNYNATNGLIQMSCALSTGGANGNGNLSAITFAILGSGQSAIKIVNASLLDPSSLTLPFNTTDGYFNNVLRAMLNVDPPEVTGSQYVPGTTFTINVTLGGVQDFESSIFNLAYDPAVIQEIDINIPSVLGQTPIKKLQVDDTAGYIWANITFHSGISTITPVTLMTIQFQVLAMGVTPLNLTNTQLYDVNSNPITHDVQNGIFVGIIRHVAVTNVTTDIQVAYQGWNVLVNVTVKNKGNMTETINAHFYYDSTLDATTLVTSVVPNEERVIQMTWNTSAVVPSISHNYTISGTVDPAPYQTDLSDINFTDGTVNIRVMGDINGDGVVNMKDIAQLVQVFHTFPGKPNWNPLFDLDRNGIVDMRDIAICVMNFGKSAP